MAGKYVEVDVSEFKEFCDKLRSAGKGGLQKELAVFLDGAGFEFLKIIQDEIMKLKSVVTTDLLSSFTKGASGNIYTLTEGDLTLEIGTNVEYASLVNDGHMTIDPSNNKHFYLPNGEMARFVPGYWKDTKYGEKFIYKPGAKTGMVLKQNKVEGKHYVENSVNAMEKLFPGYIEKKLDAWINSYF